MRFPVKTHIQGYVTFLIEAKSEDDAKLQMSSINQIDYAAEYCWNDLGEMIRLDNIDSSDLEISIIR